MPEPLLPPPADPSGPHLRVLLVAHCLKEDPRAGTESYCLSLGRALADRGHRVSFLAPQGVPMTQAREEVSWQAGELAGLPFLYFTRINPDVGLSLNHPGFNSAFRDLLRQHSFDLVHFHHTFLSSISLLKVAQDSGLPVVLTLHDAWHLCPRLHLMNGQGRCSGPESPEKCAACLEPPEVRPAGESSRQLAKFLARRLRWVKRLLPGCRLLCPSRFLRNLHYEYGVAPGEIIHWPLGLAEVGPVPQAPPATPPKFVFLGNITPVKRVEVAVEAFAPLAGQAVLEIWGQLIPPWDRPFLDRIKPYPHIIYKGTYRREDLPRILIGATATVITSDFENYPLVARESLMLGVPVLGSDAGGIPEIVKPEENGLMFPAGDADALRRQVQRLLSHPEMADRLRRGIKPIKPIGQEARELQDLYHSLLTRRRNFAAGQNLAGLRVQFGTPGPPSFSASEPRGRCSIIIPVFNNLELTRDCLESIEKSTAAGLYEIIVVDNGSTDGTRQFLETKAAQGAVRPLFNDNNLGFARASNQGARAAAGNYLVFLNNDTLATSGWLEELVRTAASDDTVAAVGAKLLFPDDTVQHAGVAVNFQRNVFHIYKHFHRDHPAVNKERCFRALTAACLLVKRPAFFEAGLFDEGFQNGFEDVDLCLKLGHWGYKLLYNPRCVVYHLESRTPGRHDKERENSLLLLSRWHDRLTPDEEEYYRQDGIILNVWRRREEFFLVMYDSNENPFWREASRLRKLGALQEARAAYLAALKFNPYDSRKWIIGAELVDLLEEMGEGQEADFFRRILAQHFPFSISFEKRGPKMAAGS